jgi:hypothetical protein
MLLKPMTIAKNAFKFRYSLQLIYKEKKQMIFSFKFFVLLRREFDKFSQ